MSEEIKRLLVRFGCTTEEVDTLAKGLPIELGNVPNYFKHDTYED